MAGSKKWFIYTDDEGNRYAINRDESNVEALGGEDYVAGETVLNELPRNCKPRYARYADATGRIVRRVIVTAAGVNAGTLPASFTVLDALGVAVDVFLRSLSVRR